LWLDADRDWRHGGREELRLLTGFGKFVAEKLQWKRIFEGACDDESNDERILSTRSD
jgi:hypothetical protein